MDSDTDSAVTLIWHDILDIICIAQVTSWAGIVIPGHCLKLQG